MEALKSLITNVPDWLKKLDELNGQIEQRQIELAKLTEEARAGSPEGSSSGAARSIRNKGSTESLKPRDEPEAQPRDEPEAQPRDPPAPSDAAGPAEAAAAKARTEQPAAPSSPSDPHSPSALQRQVSQMRAAGQARARAMLRKRQRTDSVVSAEGAGPAYRTRSMIIVYYDSYVQMFFEELVKFVSASRNMMRKAKMAAKVAQIKRLAELETPDDEADEDTTKPPPIPSSSSPGDAPIAADPAPTSSGSKPAGDDDDAEPSLPFVSTRRMGPSALMARTGRNPYSRAAAMGRASPAAGAAAGDVYDELDRGLDYVQSMCEHAAHQFLRDGDCAEEVANIKRRLAETKELADREMERVRREDPAALLKVGDDDGMRGRSYRPQSMRKSVVKPAAPAEVSAAAPAAPAAGAEKPLEVDEGVGDVDAEGSDDMPKLVYKSTRRMMG
ncbi:884aab17-1aa0-4ba6-8613-80c3f990fdc3 [Thermothielavioides terrestris]|jgi:hypothetical protein|uniref:Uncharacterized protein n=2 Tax=Thermothielavioides terrestris TaxID=2587410 RepID=G2RDY1_THETT|nr:uncharacterized protein THITE_2122680 [Thermothielavioides terrestris NRRL 8126]AEO70864.1 hypothetical protein THITE_2122680 [Thermothielavioides terrestris NRRL 8126]SPQ25151.1 884aab17-1aa0-4ba6-8613-80c3f990fdc3 [Thermothielavioides terrestris]